jgi:hypothetical protein
MLHRTARLSDYLSVGVIAKVFPMRSVQAALRECNRLSRRRRELSAEAVVYYVIALGLFRSVPASEVLRCLADGLRWARASVPLGLVGKSSISRARTRLGTKPFTALRKRVVRAFADQRTRGAWYKGLRLLAYDCTLLEVPAEARNRDAFGWLASERAEMSQPKARVTTLVEVGTQAAFAWDYGPCKESKREQAMRLLGHLSPRALLLAGRGYLCNRLWKSASNTGSQLLWKAERDDSLAARRFLADGSFLSSVGGAPARVLDYSIDGSDDAPCRLVTTLLDPSQAPAVELAALYHERWEIATARDEVKTHTLSRGSILRSKTPRLVKQEIEGLMLAHYAVRHFLQEVSRVADEAPDQLSFIQAVRVVQARPENPGTSRAIESRAAD